MFKFQTTTIINDPSRITTGTGVLKIAGAGKFYTANIKKVYKRTATEGVASTATFTISVGNSTDYSGDYRLEFYAKLDGSNNSSFANDMVFKGRPFVYEFAVSGGASNFANAIKDVIDKSAKRFGERIFNVTVGDNAVAATSTPATAYIVTVSAASNANVTPEDPFYINLTKAELSKLTYTKNVSDKGAQTITTPVAGVTTTVVANTQPFGTYGQITKDLILPTYENTGWASVASVKNELPLIGQKYTQYIIHYCKDRGIMGGSAVGQVATSITTHSIWIIENATTQTASTGTFAVLDTLFSTKLKNATIGTITDANSNGSTVDEITAAIATNSLTDTEDDLQG